MQLFVDGDACPVKAEVEKVAARHGLMVTIVSNGGLRPSANPLLRHVIVADGADAADNWIVDHIAAGDICITADIPLAARCLDKGARVMAPNGKAFTQEGIGMALGMRGIEPALARAHARRADPSCRFRQTGPFAVPGRIGKLHHGAETRGGAHRRHVNGGASNCRSARRVPALLFPVNRT